MRRKNMMKKFTSFMMALLMTLSLAPNAVFAAEQVNITEFTDELTSGQYVMAVDDTAVGTLSGSWVLAETVSQNTDTKCVSANAVVTLTVSGDKTKIQDSTGKYLAPKGKNTNGIKEGEYEWTFAKNDAGKYTFTAVDDGVILASNKGNAGKFRGYKTTTVAGNPSGYPSTFTLYKTTGGTTITVAAPLAQPQAGSVEKGTKITLSTTTENAKIWYTTDGSDPITSQTRTAYTNETAPVINDEVTLKAAAEVNGTYSEVQVLHYTLAAPLQDGDKVVIYAPAYNKALSCTYTGFYNNGKDVTVAADGTVTGFNPAEDVWTVSVNSDKTYSFSYNGKKLAMGDKFSSMPLGEKNDKWVLEEAADGCYYVKNTVRNSYIEWYAGKNNWSSFGTIDAGKEGQFALKFFKTTETQPEPEPQPETPILDGDKVVIYAPAYNKALSCTYTGFYNNGKDVTVAADGTVTGFNPAEDVWTVSVNSDKTYSFSYNGKKLAMGDKFSSMPLGEKNDKWVLEEAADGCYYVKNTVRNSYIEWYEGKNNWSSFGTIDAGKEGQFALKFFKVTEPEPQPEPEQPEGVEGLEVAASPISGASVVKGDKIKLVSAAGTEIYFTMSEDGTDPKDPEVKAEEKYTEEIKVAKTPAEGKNIVIKALVYKPAADGAKAETGPVYTFTYKAPTSIDNYDLYFGQLHSHTNISDGTGSVEQAFDHASKVPNLDFLAVTDHSNSFDGAAPDQKIHMGDAEAEENNAEWHEGKQAARDITKRENGSFVGIYGYEMTWSGGAPGHINTFNSKGFESRNMAPYKKGDNYEVMQAYFDTLNENPETISQFNHPGDTFGDFMDFALYSPITDNQMTLVEVGNGEGAIGASGYFPSYSYYTRALDKGWHVAPTNNQDNHKGNWGDSNTARSVVLSDGLSEDAIYDAIKNYRVYATEDNDFSIRYALNGNAMGSILGDQDSVNITASFNDPTDTKGTTKVEVIVNGGRTLAEKTYTGGKADITFKNLPANYGYYYLRVTQPDKNIAVTAPVWVGESINAGVSNTSSNVALPIKGDEIQISSQIYNNSQDDMVIKSLQYTMEGASEPFKTVDPATIGKNGTVAARQSFNVTFPYVTEKAGGFNINVELNAEIGGQAYTFTDVLKLTVSDPAIATKVLIDGTHYNDYVTGYYAGNMGNFINMGTQDNIQVKIAEPGKTITADDLKDTAMFVVSAPLKYTSEYTGDAKPSEFEDEFVNVVKDYVKNGGTVVVTGLADYQDSNDGLPYTSYEQANKMLSGIGSTMRINDDELIDTNENGGQPYRLYFNDYNYDAADPFVQKMLAGVKESGLTYSSYSGCSISVGKGTPVVFGHDTTYSINSKAPSQGHDKPVLSYSAPYDENTAVVKKGDVVSLAAENVGKGHVVAAGTVFVSNFEVSAEDQVSYANGIIAKNMLDAVKREPVISTIQEARHGKDGDVFTVQGTVASGTADTKNAFFNTIYIQDEEGNGINVFPIDDNTLRVGDRVQVTGSVSSYIGDKQLSAIKVTTLEGHSEVKITPVSNAEAMDYDKNFGMLVEVNGVVKSVREANGLIDNIVITDAKGNDARVFIDGYIGYSDESSEQLEKFVKVGQSISAVGFVSHDAEGNRLRVRDRSEIKKIDAVIPETTPSTQPTSKPGATSKPNGTDKPGTETKPENKPHTGVNADPLAYAGILAAAVAVTYFVIKKH